MINLKQIRAFVAVVEEGSFSRGAAREVATQSGMSQHVRALEQAVGAALLERSRDGVALTVAGRRYYEHCLKALEALDAGEAQVRALDAEVAGVLRAGLMPAFTRAALAPALERFATAYPQVSVQITEAYSGALTALVRTDELDFALVPAGQPEPGIRTTLLSRDTEMLVSSKRVGLKLGLKPLTPVVLRELPPLKLIVPGPANVRRENLQRYIDTNGVRIAAMMEMDAMLGTLEFVALSDWVTILPGLILVPDRLGKERVVNPIIEPRMDAQFVVIEPARRHLSRPAALFLEELRAQINAISVTWDAVMPGSTKARPRVARWQERGQVTRSRRK
ncbi:MAG: LysR family transcriptional regulator [Burkholderiaceae bacterium]